MNNLYLLSLLLLITCATSLAQAPDVREIMIKSSWGGLGTPNQSELRITRTKKGYKANGDDVDPARVERLINALYAPEIKELTAANLGITQQWLDQNAESATNESDVFPVVGVAPNQKQLFLSAFRDLKLVEEILPSLFRGGWTDDYPHLEIVVTETSGTAFVVRSKAQPHLMLPFEIEKNGTTTRTFNPNISRSLADLLPKNFANKDRIAGGDMRRRLAEGIMSKVEPQWKLIEVENKVGPALPELKKTYRIESADINPYHGADHGKEWKNGQTREKNVYLVLKSDAMPERFAIRVILPFVDGKVENLDRFSSTIGEYQDLVSSVGWLKELAGSGKLPIWLRFVKDASFSEKALETFTEDMRVLGKPELAAEVAQHRREIALVSVGGGLDYWQSYWLVMPDRRVILWRIGYNTVLKWSREDFASNTCPTYHSGMVQCVGAVISAEGEIVSGKRN